MPTCLSHRIVKKQQRDYELKIAYSYGHLRRHVPNTDDLFKFCPRIRKQIYNKLRMAQYCLRAYVAYSLAVQVQVLGLFILPKHTKSYNCITQTFFKEHW